MTAKKRVIAAGIDGGASAIKVSCVGGDGKIVRLDDSSGNSSFDSAVHVRSPKEVVFGEEATRLSFEDPENYIPDLKVHRGTGKTFHGLSVADLLQMDLESRVLVAFKDQFGERPTHVALCTPCHATDKHIADLVTANEKAGHTVVGTIAEPCAVALAAAAGGCVKASVGQHILVVDTGHVSTDLAVVLLGEGALHRVLRADGLLGHAGQRLLHSVCEFVLAQVAKQTGTKLVLADLAPEQRHTLMSEILKGVRALNARASVIVAVLVCKKVVAVELKTPQFKDILDEFLKPVAELAKKLIADAGLEPQAIVQVLISGGLAQNGLLRDRLAARLAMPVTRVPDPLEACARGAAMHAQALVRRGLPEAAKELPPAEAEVKLCTTHTIASVIADRGPTGERTLVCSLLVGEGEPIPLRNHKDYSLVYADQPDVTISIVRGKEGQAPHQCEKFAELVLRNLPPEKVKTSRIRVGYAISERNLCEVTATDLIGGATQTVSFEINKAGGK